MSCGAVPEAELDRLGRAVLGAASEAIVFTDREGVIRFWNPGAERLFGFAAEEALGRPVDIIIPEPQRARHWAGFRRVMETGESRYGQGDLLAVPGLRQDGSRVSLEFTVVPLRDETGRMEGMAAVLRDVTRRFEELRALRRELAAARTGADEPDARPAPGGAAGQERSSTRGRRGPASLIRPGRGHPLACPAPKRRGRPPAAPRLDGATALPRFARPSPEQGDCRAMPRPEPPPTARISSPTRGRR